MQTSARQNEFYVPTIDVEPYLSDPDCAAASDVIDQVRAACIMTGFFQITGHGIAKHLQESVFKAAADFFALPFDEKKKLDAKMSIGHRGYDVLASQSYEEGVEPDLKEVSTSVQAAFTFFLQNCQDQSNDWKIQSVGYYSTRNRLPIYILWSNAT